MSVSLDNAELQILAELVVEQIYSNLGNPRPSAICLLLACSQTRALARKLLEAEDARLPKVITEHLKECPTCAEAIAWPE